MKNNFTGPGLFFLFISSLVLMNSCDMGSYNPIARNLDPFEPLGPTAEAWFRGSGSAGDTMAEIFVLQQGSPSAGDAGGFIFIEVHDRGSAYNRTEIALTRGTYIVSGSDIDFYPYVEYTGSYQQTSNPKNNPDPIDREGELISLPTGFLLSFENLDTVIGRNDSSDRALEFVTLYQIGVFCSQVIIPGFGGTGMMTYTRETPFKGLIDGNVLVFMPKLLPQARVDFLYSNQENLPGMVMSGLLRTDSGPTGNGSMSETVTTTIGGGDEISVNYDAINISGTVPSSGSYSVRFPGDTVVTVDSQLLIPGTLDYGNL